MVKNFDEMFGILIKNNHILQIKPNKENVVVFLEPVRFNDSCCSREIDIKEFNSQAVLDAFNAMAHYWKR